MKNRFKRLIAVALVLTLQFSSPLKASAKDTSFNDDEIYNYIKTMVDMVKTKYNGEFDDKAVLQGMLKGLFSKFDPYTTYYSNDEADGFFDTMSGQVSGIGIQMSQSNNNVIIGKVLPKSPAEKAGIIGGDIITAVDDKDITGLTNEGISERVRGVKGTQVKITVNRNGVNKDFEIIRDDVVVPSGSYRDENGIGYIKLNIFSANSAQFISEALSYMDSKEIDKIILDLRDNPGGEVEQAVQIASNFVPNGVIVSLDFKDPSMEDKVYRSELEKIKYKLAVLVNENSASASEIVTGAVQDSKSGVIIGTKTFGKAKVQSVLPLLTPEAYEKYKAMLGVDVVDAYDIMQNYGIKPLEREIQGWTKITTGRYMTPNGRMIDLKGIEPDIYIKDNTEESSFDINELTPLSNDAISKDSITVDDIVKVKKLLSLAGYKISDFSNTFDSTTINELIKFQQDRSFEATGFVDSTTRDALNGILNLTNVMVNRGYYKAIELLNK